MKRWLIRSSFIALLVVCAVGWVGSYVREWGLIYMGRPSYSVDCNRGSIQLMWGEEWFMGGFGGWAVTVGKDEAFALPASPRGYIVEPLESSKARLVLGLHVMSEDGCWVVRLPFWFLTAPVVGFLLLA